MRWFLAPVLFVVALLAATMARAHYKSITWSEVTVHPNGSVDYRLQIPVKDLSEALGLDSHRPATVVELREGRDKLLAYFLPKLRIWAGDQRCRDERRSVDNVEAEELRAELRFSSVCPATAPAIRIEYEMFFDWDPSHLGLYVVHHPGGVLTGEFSRKTPTLTIPLATAPVDTEPAQAGGSSVLGRFMWFGAEHLFSGWDHLAFLAALLVSSAAAGRRAENSTSAAKAAAIWPVVSLVTAFTVAHSITLALAALGRVSVPSQWSESAIACSIVFVAIENLRGHGRSRYRPLLVFCFGLIHGLGFATALQTTLPSAAKLVPLLAFNLGLEIAQVTLVLTFFPLLRYAAQKSPDGYQKHVLGWGSACIAAAGVFWLGQRLLYFA